jgi:hypothetical protein
LSLREGPAYSYSWGFYGINGSRVLRYGGSLIARWKGNAIEAGYRKQFGLQDRMPNNGYWSFSVMRQMAKACDAADDKSVLLGRFNELLLMVLVLVHFDVECIKKSGSSG